MNNVSHALDRDGSESPRVGRRSTDYRRSRARDTRSPVSLSPARRRERMRSRQRSRSPYRHASPDPSLTFFSPHSSHLRRARQGLHRKGLVRGPSWPLC